MLLMSSNEKTYIFIALILGNKKSVGSYFLIMHYKKLIF